jgi:hypothetical protein
VLEVLPYAAEAVATAGLEGPDLRRFEGLIRQRAGKVLDIGASASKARH